jgi:hypothetical protein
MADLYSSLGDNRRIRPSSEFGTPRLTPVILNTDEQTLPSGETYWSTDDDAENLLPTGDFQSANSMVFRAVQAIQQFCEVYQVSGSSDSDFLTVMCRDSSIPYNDGTTFVDAGSTITKLQTVVREALGGAAVLVTIGRLKDDDTKI